MSLPTFPADGARNWGPQLRQWGDAIEAGLEVAATTEEVASVNIFNPATVTNGFYVNQDSGALNTLANYSASDYIPVEPGTTQRSNNSSSRAYYTADKVYIPGGVNANTSTAPANAAYIRFSIVTTAVPTTMMVNGTTLPAEYIPYEVARVLSGAKVSADDIIGNLAPAPTTWTGKNWIAIGDSITQYRYPDQNGITLNWAEDTAERLGVATLKRCAQEGKAMHQIADIMTYSATTAAEISAAHLITVSLGQNDRTNALGVITDPPSNDGSSFTGSTKWLVEYLLGLNPTATLAFITPTPSATREARLTQQADIIKAVCALYSVPVFDLNRISGFNTYNFATFYIDSTVHPNGRGYRRMGRQTAAFLEGL